MPTPFGPDPETDEILARILVGFLLVVGVVGTGLYLYLSTL